MAQNITLMGASYSAVPAVTLPKTGGGTATFTDVTDTTAAAADVASGKYFYTAAGVKTQGTNSGGGGGASNVVKGTFKSSLNGYSISVSTGYSGNGYPISIAIFPSEGSYKTGSPAYLAVRRYGLVSWTAVKCDPLAEPTYLSTSADDMSVSVIYKSSASNANQYSGATQINGAVLSNSSASRTYYLCARYNNSNKLSVYIGGTSYGFIPDIEYTYIIVFSE